MELSHIADGRDDCWVPWISTYSPERAQMGTDTDCVHRTIVPVGRVCGGSTTGGRHDGTVAYCRREG
jgi:hypothetical protein